MSNYSDFRNTTKERLEDSSELMPLEREYAPGERAVGSEDRGRSKTPPIVKKFAERSTTCAEGGGSQLQRTDNKREYIQALSSAPQKS